MATFIKRRIVEALNKDDEVVEVERYWSDEELLDLISNDPSSFFEVPESHADNVLRKQRNYQEVLGDVLETYRATVLGYPNVAVPEASGGGADQSADDVSGNVESNGAATPPTAGDRGSRPPEDERAGEPEASGEDADQSADDVSGNVESNGAATPPTAGDRGSRPPEDERAGESEAARGESQPVGSGGPRGQQTARAANYQHRTGASRRGNRSGKGSR